MADAFDILLDDRALIEIAGYVMCGRSDELHTFLVCLMVGLCPLEAGQERVMDVYAAP